MHNLKRGMRSYISLSAFSENEKNMGQLELQLNPAWKAVAWNRAPGAVTKRNKTVWPPAACPLPASCYPSINSTVPSGDLLAQKFSVDVGDIRVVDKNEHVRM